MRGAGHQDGGGSSHKSSLPGTETQARPFNFTGPLHEDGQPYPSRRRLFTLGWVLL